MLLRGRCVPVPHGFLGECTNSLKGAWSVVADAGAVVAGSDSGLKVDVCSAARTVVAAVEDGSFVLVVSGVFPAVDKVVVAVMTSFPVVCNACPAAKLFVDVEGGSG